MKKKRSSFLWRYGFALLAVALTLVVVYIFIRYRIRVSLAWPILGVLALVSWYGGRGPGLLAAFCFSLTANYLSPPAYTFKLSFIEFNRLGFLVVLVLLISARRQTQQALRQSQEWLSVTLKSIGDAVITTDTEGLVTFMNPVASTLTGWESKEALGRPLSSVFRIINENTREPAEDAVSKVLQTGRVENLANHTALIARDGTERSIEDSAAPIKDETGRVVGVVLVFHDVTERKRAEAALREREERYELVVAGAEAAIWDWDIPQKRVVFSPRWKEMRGLSDAEVSDREEEWSGRIHPEDYERVLAAVEAHFEGRTSVFAEEYRVRHKDGHWIWILDHGLARRDEAGQVIRMAGSETDITERKRTEEAQREADHRKDKFIATLAHELRNPLAPIRNAVRVLKAKDLSDPGLQWCREVIDRQVLHMARLLDDLLDVSRITHDKLELRKERIELGAVIESAIETSRPLIEDRRHELTVVLPTEPVYLDADPVRLAQVFSNLLNNAAKYTEPGGQIRLTCERQGSDVAVSVQDNGIGIAAEVLPRIFEFFSQAKAAPARAPGGLGIGLSLASKLVELQGGSFEARSDGPGKGSEFIVRLPLAVKEAMREAASGSEAVEHVCVLPRRILIVDDSRDGVDSWAALLAMQGHEIYTAYDGEEAITAAEKFKPEVILLDIGMPKLSGYDVCQYIRDQAWGKGMFLIALTGWGQEADRRRTREAGFDHHMLKPLDPDALASLLASITER